MIPQLQQRARAILAANFTPPQRYGTAFHVTPPFTDVRELPGAVGNFDQAQWENLSDEDQLRILNINLSDPYLAWQVANVAAVAGKIIHVASGQSQQLAVSGAGLYWIVLDEGAQLAIEDQIMDSDVILRRMFVWQKASSRLVFTGLRGQTNFLNEKLQVELLGSEAETEIRHLTYGQEKEQFDIAVEVFHRSPHTTSRLQVRTAAAGKHKAIYRGLIDVDQAAGGTNGYQSGQALLLSRQAVVDQLPKLAIRTNDVRCSHGVTTTHLDDLALFYLRSRGLAEVQAGKLAITGFFHHQLDIPANIRESLEHVLA